MTQPVQLRENYFAIKVPEEAQDFEISIEDDDAPIVFFCHNRNLEPLICLPRGTWQIVCTSKDVSEKVAASIVSEYGQRKAKSVYKDYSLEHLWVTSARESLESLLRSLNLNGNQLILKKL